MNDDYIQRVDIQRYGCARNVSVSLSPIHALIGPNDSGKSTILRAMRTAAQFAAGRFWDTANPFKTMMGLEDDGQQIALHYRDELAYMLESRGRGGIWESVWEHERRVLTDTNARASSVPGLLSKPSELPSVQTLASRLTTATMLRLDPNALREPAPQILSQEPVRFFDERGKGLASVYQAINTRDVDGFVALRDRVRTLFPTVRTLRVPTVENNAVALEVELTNGTIVPADAMSEGLLYFLGYAAIQHLERTTLLLVEEPENGLHPARIAEVVKILRELSERTQVIIATHSPLVVNELQGPEVSVITRGADSGTQAVLLKDVPGFDDAMKVYQPGEFWVSYCDGAEEKALLTGKSTHE
ncbi:MAG: AAA family ATPase [Polyangiaceae bacterium]|nr:AAA family ATPase [Polyangiaceae bacterium]